MNKEAQEGLVTVFRAMLAELRPGENFDFYRFTEDMVNLRLSVGSGGSKWSVERSMLLEDLERMHRYALITANVSHLFEMLRKPTDKWIVNLCKASSTRGTLCELPFGHPDQHRDDHDHRWSR